MHFDGYFRITFVGHITSDVAMPLPDVKAVSNEIACNTLYTMLRSYRSLQTHGYGIKEKTTSYKPYKLVLSFREVPPNTLTANITSLPIGTNETSLVIIYALPVSSIYQGDLTFFPTC